MELRVVWRSQGEQIQRTTGRRQVEFVLFLLALLSFAWRPLCYGDATSGDTSSKTGKAMLKGIDNVGIAVTDLKRSIAFYEKLGFTKGQDYEAGVAACTLTAGSAVLFLFQTKQAGPQGVKREATLAQ
ncbi:MAG TPA: VOC family protein, partial [Candidatus Binatia bacterium]|nr:VOC family protein [Candidatus Binatia bacterium]